MDALEILRRLVSEANTNGFLVADLKRARGREQPDPPALPEPGSEFEDYHVALSPKEVV